MRNSSEDKSYWYLRLNGFFIIDNFVIHKSKNVEYSADADLVGIRTPFVFEEIGGQPDDWDKNLFKHFDPNAIIGIICQTKGGAIGDGQLFREPYLSYCVERIGFTSNKDSIISQLNKSPVATIINELGQLCQVAKILISRDEPTKDINYLLISLENVYSFIRQRIEKYPSEKYRDLNFFSSIGFQTLIEINELDNRQKKRNNLTFK